MSKSTSSHHESIPVPMESPSSPQDDAAAEINEQEPALFNERVDEFAKALGLSHRGDLFRKASHILQGDTPLNQIPEITNEEIWAVKQESEKKWHQPKILYFTILVCSLGAVEQGWAQTSMNGANLYVPKAFGIDSGSPHDTLVLGLLNSGIFLSVGLFGAWLSSPLNDRLGRRGGIFVGNLVCLISSVGSALSQSWPMLLFFRLFLGIGMGLNASTVSIYAAECAPAAIRGGLAVSWQMFTAFGIFLGFVANAAFYNYGANTWRFQLAGPLVPTIPILLMVYGGPESPAWHIKNNRYDRAFHSLCRLRNTELQAAKEVYQIYLQRSARAKSSELDVSLPRKILELFTIPRNRRATVASYVVMLSQQLCGINIIAFYSSTIFKDGGFSDFGALIASCIFGFVNFIGAFPAVWTMDSFGRRSLLLLTLPFMAVTMLIAGLSFNIPRDNPVHFGLLATLVYLFCAEYSPGMGPVPVAYSAEIFPLSHREAGMSFAIATANIWAAFLSLTFPALLSGLGSGNSFGLYAGLNIVALLLIFFFVPETKMKTLDELDEVFSVPTRSFVKYQVTEWLPWFTKRYILRKGLTDPPSFGTEDSAEYSALLQQEE